MGVSHRCNNIKNHHEKFHFGNEDVFKGKLPGRDFLYSFFNRHRDILSLRLVPNYSRKTASVSGEMLNQYFDNLENTLIDVPHENQINFDETNLSDDPGKKKCIVRRGTK